MNCFVLGQNEQSAVVMQASKLFDSANQTAAEAVHNARTVAAFSLQPQLSQLYQQQLLQPTRSVYKNSQAAGLGFGYSQCSIYLVYALGFWYGGKQIASGAMSFTEMLKVCLPFSLFTCIQLQAVRHCRIPHLLRRCCHNSEFAALCCCPFLPSYHLHTCVQGASVLFSVDLGLS